MIETSQLSQALSALFGRSEVKTDADARAPGVGPLLLNQFSEVDSPREERRLPSGRLILDGWDRQSGSHAIVVTEASDVTRIAAVALLTHLCPKNGVVETLRSTNARAFKEHLPCELNYSLVILYARGATPDSNLNADLTKWALASIKARQRELANISLLPRLDRKLLLKRFVRVLGDRATDLRVADAAFPVDVQATAGE
ncbi:MAG TPA: hypothetical protein VHY36_05665 [Steroidobacteraceae bacterium]|jgi:hypothetical protein|nr:hypothetical protein [Steroidobacteraceae bacterium]